VGQEEVKECELDELRDHNYKEYEENNPIRIKVSERDLVIKDM